MQSLGLFVNVALILCFADGTNTTRTIRHIKTNNAAEVIVVSNFLPLFLAKSWRDQLLSKWKHLDEDDPNFLYATNEHNKKVRSLNNIQERRDRAWEKKLTAQFSYGKWELNPIDPLISEISEFMLRNETTAFISDALGLNSNKEQLSTHELSDLFVSHFTAGDFLSAHSDFYSGTFAFVVSLTSGVADDEWTSEGQGGQLALLCADKPPRVSFPPLCQHIPPTFNQLVLFRTRPGPLHSVEAVVPEGYAQGFRRLAFTGWYMGASDTFSDKELEERNEMRGKHEDTAASTKSTHEATATKHKARRRSNSNSNSKNRKKTKPTELRRMNA